MLQNHHDNVLLVNIHFEGKSKILLENRRKSTSHYLLLFRVLPMTHDGPWRSANQNDYPWRDAHLPAYRQITLKRSEKMDENLHSCQDNGFHTNDQKTERKPNITKKKCAAYRPQSEHEVRKLYIQSTGKDPNGEVYQALKCKSTVYSDNHQHINSKHSFYSDIPKTQTLKTIDLTPNQQSYQSDQSCIHILPQNTRNLDLPYLKIFNAPVTYLH